MVLGRLLLARAGVPSCLRREAIIVIKSAFEDARLYSM